MQPQKSQMFIQFPTSQENSGVGGWGVGVGGVTWMVTEINGHRDKWSPQVSNLSSVNDKIAPSKQQHVLNACHDICFELYIVVETF